MIRNFRVIVRSQIQADNFFFYYSEHYLMFLLFLFFQLINYFLAQIIYYHYRLQFTTYLGANNLFISYC
jgi:hypothetical protein